VRHAAKFNEKKFRRDINLPVCALEILRGECASVFLLFDLRRQFRQFTSVNQNLNLLLTNALLTSAAVGF
jgi:hypothetical protein